MTNSMVVLGSTGSIGTQTLEFKEKYNMKICALTAHSNVKLMEEQVRKFRPVLAVMYDEKAAEELKISLADTDTRVLCGMDGLIEAATLEGADVVLNSLVGMVGLEPTLAACKAHKMPKDFGVFLNLQFYPSPLQLLCPHISQHPYDASQK